MKNVLVTGATGFIGSRLINLLISEGFYVRAIGKGLPKGIDTIFCDFFVDNIPEIAFNDIDIVIHLAGYAHDLKNSPKKYSTYQKINVDATVKLLSLSANHSVKKFIFVSSVKAGGLPLPGECASEKQQVSPDGIYGKTKRDAEIKALDIGRQSCMHVSIVRPSLVYGPGAKGNLASMLMGIEKGWFPPLPETGNRRSMVHVDDLVLAILFVINDELANGEVFIVTDGAPHSSREIYDGMRYVLGKAPIKWSIPKVLFNIVSMINTGIRYKVNKLLGDECYSSAKIEALGFKANKSLRDMNETDY